VIAWEHECDFSVSIKLGNMMHCVLNGTTWLLACLIAQPSLNKLYVNVGERTLC
jgi:hypothetical protein